MNLSDIIDKCPEDGHCYHRDGVLLTSDPPKYRLHCCRCGHMSYTLASTRPPAWGQHGKFYREDRH